MQVGYFWSLGMSKITQYLSPSMKLVSLNTIISSFIYAFANDKTFPFSWPNSIPSNYVQNFIFITMAIHKLVDTWRYLRFLVVVSIAGMSTDVQVCPLSPDSISLPAVGSLSHIAALLHLSESAPYSMATWASSPTSGAKFSPFNHTLPGYYFLIY